MHRKERGHANPFDVQLSHTMAGPFGSNHGDVHAGRRNHLAEVNVEAVREHQGLTRVKMRRNGLLVDLFLRLVRNQHHHKVSQLCDFLDGTDRKARGLGPLSRRAGWIARNHDVHTAVTQVQCMRMTLASSADNSHALALEQCQVAMLFVIDVCHDSFLSKDSMVLPIERYLHAEALSPWNCAATPPSPFVPCPRCHKDAQHPKRLRLFRCPP